MHIPDLDLVRYHTGPFDADNWAVPLRAIGWLQYPQPFTSGASSAELIAKLKALVEQARAAYQGYCFRGMMRCTVRLAAGLPSPGPIWSQENIFVPAEASVYCAPGGIVHYVEGHSYLPPSEFQEAVMCCPDCRSRAYQEALRAANGGFEPPLKMATHSN